MKKNIIKALSSKGSVSIFVVMSILAVILVISIGSSFVVSTESRLSLSNSESVSAYYAAESGLEAALYDKVHLNQVPRGNRCAGNCPAPACGWTCTENNLYITPYCLEITPSGCDPGVITSIKSVGEYKTTRRSIEIFF